MSIIDLVLAKAKRANVGEVRYRKNGPHQKQADGKWKKVKKGRDGKWVLAGNKKSSESKSKKSRNKKKGQSKPVIPKKKKPTRKKNPASKKKPAVSKKKSTSKKKVTSEKPESKAPIKKDTTVDQGKESASKPARKPDYWQPADESTFDNNFIRDNLFLENRKNIIESNKAVEIQRAIRGIVRSSKSEAYSDKDAFNTLLQVTGDIANKHKKVYYDLITRIAEAMYDRYPRKDKPTEKKDFIQSYYNHVYYPHIPKKKPSKIKKVNLPDKIDSISKDIVDIMKTHMSTKSGYHVYDGIFFESRGLTSTDGRRLLHVPAKISKSVKDFRGVNNNISPEEDQVVLPTTTEKEIQSTVKKYIKSKNFRDRTKGMTDSQKESEIKRFEETTRDYDFKPLQGKYPNIDKVVPDLEKRKTTEINPDNYRKVLNAIISQSDALNQVMLSHPNQRPMPDDESINANARFIRDSMEAFKKLGHEKLYLHLSEDSVTKPIVISPEKDYDKIKKAADEGGNYSTPFSLIMPIKDSKASFDMEELTGSSGGGTKKKASNKPDSGESGSDGSIILDEPPEYMNSSQKKNSGSISYKHIPETASSEVVPIMAHGKQGDKMKTESGRVTGPLPKMRYKNTKRGMKNVHKWLKEEAMKEMQHRIDTQGSAGITPNEIHILNPDNWSRSDSYRAASYLFGHGTDFNSIIKNSLVKSLMSKEHREGWVLLLKAKKANVGEIRHRKNGPHQKQADGKWKKVKKGKDGKWVLAGGSSTAKKKKGSGSSKGESGDGSNKVIESRKERKSKSSEYIYQVRVDKGWAKYKTLEAYRKDYPNGPEAGHILVNSNHPDHLGLNPDTFYIKKDGKKYYSKAEFLKENKMPDRRAIKKHLKEKKGQKGMKGKIFADFSHPEWHSTSDVKLSADHRKYLGLEGKYKKYRQSLKWQRLIDRYKRMGIKPPNPETANYENAEKAIEGKRPPVPPRKKNLPDKKGRKTTTSRGQSVIRRGSRVLFQYRGKEYEGKVVDTESKGKDGQKVKKAATHYTIEFDKKGQVPADLRRKEKKVVEVKKENVRRKQKARKNRSQTEQDAAQEEKLASKLEKKTGQAMKKLGAKDNQEFQDKVKEMIVDFSDPKSTLHKTVAKKVAAVISKMNSSGMAPMSDLTHAQLMKLGLAGVYNAILDFDPSKGAKLTTFLQSDKMQDYISDEIKDALMVERGQIHKMSPDLKRAAYLIKQVRDNMRNETGEAPKNRDVAAEYEKIYGNPKKLDLNKLARVVSTRRVSNVIENMNEEGQVDIADQQFSTFKGPDQAYLEKEKMGRFHGLMQNILADSHAKDRFNSENKFNYYKTQLDIASEGGAKGDSKEALTIHSEITPKAKVQADVMKLRHRVDETTTGKGVFGEESEYYNSPTEDVSEYKGATRAGSRDRSGNPTRSWEDIGRQLNITANEAKKQYEEATERVRNMYESGHKDAKELYNMFFNKSRRWRRADLFNYMMKSQMLTKSLDLTVAEGQVKRTQAMLKSILEAA